MTLVDLLETICNKQSIFILEIYDGTDKILEKVFNGKYNKDSSHFFCNELFGYYYRIVDRFEIKNGYRQRIYLKDKTKDEKEVTRINDSMLKYSKKALKKLKDDGEQKHREMCVQLSRFILLLSFYKVDDNVRTIDEHLQQMERMANLIYEYFCLCNIPMDEFSMEKS